MAKTEEQGPGPSDRLSMGKEIEPGIVSMVARGLRFFIRGGDKEWFGPNQPLTPIAQDQAIGRQFDYPVGFNMFVTPRAEETISFAQMRALADGYDLLRLVIETRKDQLVKLKWSVKAIDDSQPTEDDVRVKEIMDFFKFPDKEHDWATWLRMILEDMLVIDAAAIYPRMNRGGGLFSLEPVDGATIKRVLDQTGRTPLPPDPAYQQILKGVPAVDYSRDQLVYRPRNLRTNRVYGFSPVEQIIMTVNIALRRQIHQLNYYTEGNIPEAFIGVPATWTPEQIAQFQAFWDSLISGNLAARRKARFVPETISKSFVQTKEGALKDDYDDWLARIVCYAFSVSAQPLLKQINKGEADTQREIAMEEGLAPSQMWIKSLVDYLIWKYWGYTDLHMVWDEDEALDPEKQMKVDTGYVAAKIKHPDEVRAELGMEPLTEEQKLDLNPPVPDAFGGDEGGAVPGKKPGKEKEPTESVEKRRVKKKSSRFAGTAY